jgi:hypothetical protein
MGTPMHEGHSYERQLALVSGLERPTTATERAITWTDASRVLGLARDPDGHIEIFVQGPPLVATIQTVRENLEHQEWYRRDGDLLPASRLLLPSAAHFEQVAAFLCTELLRSGVLSDSAAAFARAEPVIALAIDRLRLSDQAILGLCGELLLLRALCVAAPAERVPHVIDAWKGWRETSRDFQLEGVGIEVKTTTRSASVHKVQGVEQVELGHGVDGAEESAFFLTSVGLQWTEASNEEGSVNLPELVDSIIGRTDAAMGSGAAPVVERLVQRIRSYGGANEVGYDHGTQASAPAFSRRFRSTFVRTYDMEDPRIQVLRTTDLDRAVDVDPRSVRFAIRLRDQVAGDVNPFVGLRRSAEELLRGANWLASS